MIEMIDSALNNCERAKLLLKGYEIQKETNSLSENDEGLSIMMISEYLDRAIECLSDRNPEIHTNTSTPSRSGFPLRLKRAMKAAGLTQKELAERAGVSQSVISRLITGKDKTGTRSGVLSHALGINFGWLHYGTGEMYPANFSADNHEV